VTFLFASVVLLLQAPAVSVWAAAPADLRIRTTATSFTVGSNGSYNVSVRNESNIPADDTIQIVSTLPQGLTYVSGIGAGWTCSGSSGRSVNCKAAGLAPGDSIGFTLVVAVCNAARPSVTTTFEAVYEADPNLGNNVATRSTSVKAGTCVEPTATPTATPRSVIIIVPPQRQSEPVGAAAAPTPAATDLSLSQESTGLFTVGATPSYVFRVTNIGSVATNFPTTFHDTLPRGLSFLTASGHNWSCSAAGQRVTCVHETPLRAGEASDLLLTVAVGSSAYPSVTNYATISYAGDISISNSSVLRPVTIRRTRRGTRVTPLSR
jgi:uncharacterized repeat protein (TIGR01451 family)